MNSHEQILDLFNNGVADFPPIFSGLISVTDAGLENESLKFHETHRNAAKMARAAASTYRFSGLRSAVLPLDLYVEAEALGATVDFREASEAAEYPRVTDFLYKSVEEFNPKDTKVTKVEKEGRIPLVCETIELLKEDVGNEVVIGAFVPGPFTLLSLLVETGALYTSLRKSAGAIHKALNALAELLSSVGNAYYQAGADFLTVHEMGGSPGILGPKIFESIVLPHLQTTFSRLPHPSALSACGRTNGMMYLMAASGADALSVDQTNDLTRSRKDVPDILLFGNLDPVGVISQGTPDELREAVSSVVQSGADAVWPGCDLHLQTPLENLRTLVEASANR
jgi:MtaA/CmuA family methyltransferase